MAISKKTRSLLEKIHFAGGDISVTHPGKIIYSLKTSYNGGLLFGLSGTNKTLYLFQSRFLPTCYHGQTADPFAHSDRIFISMHAFPYWRMTKDNGIPVRSIQKVMKRSRIPRICIE